jgi:hypothetical protein
VVIKAHAVDQTFGIDQTEDPWLIVARLRTRRHGTNFNGTKTHRPERINALAVFIQPGGQTQRVLKVSPMQVTGFVGTFWRTSISSGVPKHGVIVEK